MYFSTEVGTFHPSCQSSSILRFLEEHKNLSMNFHSLIMLGFFHTAIFVFTIGLVLVHPLRRASASRFCTLCTESAFRHLLGPSCKLAPTQQILERRLCSPSPFCKAYHFFFGILDTRYSVCMCSRNQIKMSWTSKLNAWNWMITK